MDWKKLERQAERQLAESARQNRVRAGEERPTKDGDENLFGWDEMTAEERAAAGVGTECGTCGGYDGNHVEPCVDGEESDEEAC